MVVWGGRVNKGESLEETLTLRIEEETGLLRLEDLSNLSMSIQGFSLSDTI